MSDETINRATPAPAFSPAVEERQPERASGPRVQFRRQLAGMSYDDQVAAVSPSGTARETLPRLPPSPVQMKAEQEGDTKLASLNAHANRVRGIQFSPVQFEAGATPAAAEVGQAALDRAETRKLEWRKVEAEGKVLGWYVVQLEAGETGTGEAAPVDIEPVDEKDPALEQWCEAFEAALGAAAFSAQGKPASNAMAGRCVQIMDAYVAQLTTANEAAESTDGVFARVLGRDQPSFAGAVGNTDEAVVRKAAQGNLREQITLSLNFAWQIGSDLSARTTDMTAFFEEANRLSGQVDKPTDSKLVESLKKVQVDPNAYFIPNTDLMVPVDGEEGTRDLKKLQGETRIKNPSAGGASGQDISQRTAGDLGHAGLSKAEIEHMKLAKENLSSQQLAWSEGRRMWYINEKSDWVQKVRAAGLPLGAGVSGTTQQIMGLRDTLGVSDAVTTRAAAIGYLIPIRAHTLVEILQAAAAYGLDAPNLDLTMYLSIAPFASASVYNNPKFWRIVAQTQRHG